MKNGQMLKKRMYLVSTLTKRQMIDTPIKGLAPPVYIYDNCNDQISTLPLLALRTAMGDKQQLRGMTIIIINITNWTIALAVDIKHKTIAWE
uniref:Uncharacterized protein n=1 Tax=Romanomermis culicivorax TaxID=13658 RepID=A0A915I0M2_ROMCU